MWGNRRPKQACGTQLVLTFVALTSRLALVTSNHFYLPCEPLQRSSLCQSTTGQHLMSTTCNSSMRPNCPRKNILFKHQGHCFSCDGLRSSTKCFDGVLTMNFHLIQMPRLLNKQQISLKRLQNSLKKISISIFFEIYKQTACPTNCNSGLTKSCPSIFFSALILGDGRNLKNLPMHYLLTS